MSLAAAESEGMTGKLVGIARKALTLGLIELLVPGGTLVVLALLLTGTLPLPIEEKVAPLLPFLKAFRRPCTPPQGRQETVPVPP